MARNYNAVGAGVTPKLGDCKWIDGEASNGGNGGHNIGAVKVDVEIPRAARPGGSQGGGLMSQGAPLPAARPGGMNDIARSSSVKSGPRGIDD